MTESFWRRAQKKIGVGLLCFTFLLGAFGPSISIFSGTWAPQTHAAESDYSDLKKKFSEGAGFITGLLVPVIGIETAMIGIFMDNEFIIGKGGVVDASRPVTEQVKETQDIGVLLNYVWQIVRNMVNYMFIVVLIVMAFMVVATAGGGIGGGETSLQIGKVLPKFVIAVVAVNFTWFGAKIILDAASIATDVVFSIPQSVGINTAIEKCISPLEASKQTGKNPSPTCPVSLVKMDIHNGKITGNAKGGWDNGEGKDQIIYRTDLVTMTFEWKKEWKQFSHKTFASVFAYSILQVQSLPMTDGKQIDWADLTLQAVFSFLVMLVIIAIFTILFLVVLERVLILWVNIVLSPIGVLVWVMKDIIPINIGSDDNNILGFNAFVHRAFIPAIIGIPVVFATIMIMVAKSAEMENMQVANGGIEIIGASKLINGVDDFQALFWYILTLAVLWQSANLASKSAVIVKPAVDGIKQGVEGVGKFIMQTPAYLPWIPIGNSTGGKKDGAAFADLSAMLKDLPNIHTNEQYNRMSRQGMLFGGQQGGNSVDSHLQGLDSTIQSQMRTLLNNKGSTLDIAKKLANASRSEDAVNILNRNGIHSATTQNVADLSQRVVNAAQQVYSGPAAQSTQLKNQPWQIASTISINMGSSPADVARALKSAGYNNYNDAKKVVVELREQGKTSASDTEIEGNWSS